MDAVFLFSAFQLQTQNSVLISLLFSFVIFLLIFCIEFGFRLWEGPYAIKNRKRIGMIFYVTLVILFLEFVSFISIESIQTDQQVIVVLLTICVIYTSILYFQKYTNFSFRKRSILKKIRQGSDNGERRFTMLVEEVVPDKKNSATAVCGIVHGTVRIHDRVYAYIPGCAPRTFEIVRIRTGSKNTNFAKDEACGIYLNEYMEEGVLPKYTIISNIKTRHRKEKEINAESPELRGLIGEYQQFVNDHEFMSVLVYQIVHATYIVPVQLTQEKVVIKDPTTTMPQGTNFVFPQVSQKRKPNQKLLPIYTDWDAVYHWDHLLDDVPSGAILMKFPEMVEVAEKDYEGITINPFGPQPFFMSDAFIQSIKKLPGYREEFLGEKIDETKENV